ncbi:hypothetical protein FGX01_06130, partial [Xylella fastidiosa subsp. multiplex]|nr:hypothetical protein [Xylella fastidiosa subsp. multiplex]
GGTIRDSIASGRVSGGDYFTGGLVGRMTGGNIDNSHATGSITSTGGAAPMLANQPTSGVRARHVSARGGARDVARIATHEATRAFAGGVAGGTRARDGAARAVLPDQATHRA